MRPPDRDARAPMDRPTMNIRRRRFLHLVAGAATGAAGTGLAQAQAYPSRPVTLIVPYGAGGPTDTIARILADSMHAPLGQPVIVENVIGASGSIGIGRGPRPRPVA